MCAEAREDIRSPSVILCFIPLRQGLPLNLKHVILFGLGAPKDLHLLTPHVWGYSCDLYCQLGWFGDHMGDPCEGVSTELEK